MEETSEELQAKLMVYKQQALQLAEARAKDPYNLELQQLQSNLIEATTIIEDLLKFQEAKEAEKPAETPFHPNQGDVVSAFYSPDNAYRNAIITSFTEKKTAVIKFLGYPSQTTEAEILALRRPIEPDQIKLCVGANCYAVYSEDGLWYSAVIDAISPSLDFSVTYAGYGNAETVGKYYIRPVEPVNTNANQPASGAPKKNKASGKRAQPEPESSNLLAIPEHLKILPGDSEDVRKKKKKQLHAIKGQNRLIAAEQERKSKQDDWKKFVTKKGGKVFKGSSIFSTPDNPNAKVGVIGSGHTPTEFAKAKRYVLNVDGEEEEQEDEA